MEFLDPLYRRRHAVRLYTSYVLATTLVITGAILLLFVAFGFDIGKNGQVIQNGLLFASSRPDAATIYLDGVSADRQTNTRLNIPEGNYDLQLKRDGYRTWQHRITIVGGKVIRYDYPFLFPERLTTATVKSYGAAAPGLMTQTPDSRWLFVQPTPTAARFDVFDLDDPATEPTNLVIPSSVYTAGGKQSWRVVGWADNKVHLLLKHGYGAKGASEFILFNREEPEESVNLSRLIDGRPSEVSLIDSKHDRYYVYFAKNDRLQTASLNDPEPEPYLEDVLEYQPYQDDTMVYVTPTTGNDNRVDVRLRRGNQTYTVRQIAPTKRYQIAVSEYEGKPYVALAAPDKKVVYVYKDPVGQVAGVTTAPVPTAALAVESPAHISFSVGGRFIVAQRGTSFATYDAEYKDAASYTMDQPMDKGQTYATWMDGAHLQYVSNQQLLVFDYDGTNAQLLVPAIKNASVYYDKDRRYVYLIAPPNRDAAQKNQAYTLSRTALRTPTDL